MAIAILATESDAGKTHLVSALCKIFQSTFPFKGQNMSLNAFLTGDSGEIAFAQAYQSLVSGRNPAREMNPVLLKPVDKNRVDVIFNGRSLGVKPSSEYFCTIKKSIQYSVFDIFQDIVKKEKRIIVEGAGSCSEINMKKFDFSNLNLCKRFDIPFFVVSDIERGGVFAKIVGTYELLEKKERELLVGFIINKMYGDKSLLKEGIDFIEKKTGRKVIGVIPYFEDLKLPEEDSMGFSRPKFSHLNSHEVKGEKKLKIRVVKTPYISNFFDFYPFALSCSVDFSWAFSPYDLDNADVVILPGSRNVFYDLEFLRKSGFAEKICKLAEEIKSGRRKSILIGICGGYEMMFDEIEDNFSIEGNGEVKGLGIIKGKVCFSPEKTLGWETINFQTVWFSGPVRGFNMRHGVLPFQFFSEGLILGTSLHGIFWQDDFRNSIFRFFGISTEEKFSELFEREISRWTEWVKNNVDVSEIQTFFD
ncbi:Cobyric acid synthase [bacterium HR19]|nr:Cobyric acid synthase [bacterium HR19]